MEDQGCILSFAPFLGLNQGTESKVEQPGHSVPLWDARVGRWRISMPNSNPDPTPDPDPDRCAGPRSFILCVDRATRTNGFLLFHLSLFHAVSFLFYLGIATILVYYNILHNS